MWWGWAVLAALVRIILYYVNVTCLRVHDPPSPVPRLTGPESASPVESCFCHFTLWLFTVDSWSLAPLADALCFSKLVGFLLLIQMLNNLKGDPLEIRYNIQCLKKHQTRFYWVCLFEIMVISLMLCSPTTKATTQHHHHHNNHHHQRPIRQSDFFSIAHSLCKKPHGVEVPVGALYT